MCYITASGIVNIVWNGLCSCKCREGNYTNTFEVRANVRLSTLTGFSHTYDQNIEQMLELDVCGDQ